mmetsp:Transcript_57736/g.162841  ORF Transcript_57736/g.162841 Transcript_57736/m.162841 type:complete len:265 (-) Transcript_57736:4-798(-)
MCQVRETVARKRYDGSCGKRRPHRAVQDADVPRRRPGRRGRRHPHVHIAEFPAFARPLHRVGARSVRAPLREVVEAGEKVLRGPCDVCLRAVIKHRRCAGNFRGPRPALAAERGREALHTERRADGLRLLPHAVPRQDHGPDDRLPRGCARRGPGHEAGQGRVLVRAQEVPQSHNLRCEERDALAISGRDHGALRGDAGRGAAEEGERRQPPQGLAQPGVVREAGEGAQGARVHRRRREHGGGHRGAGQRGAQDGLEGDAQKVA